MAVTTTSTVSLGAFCDIDSGSWTARVLASVSTADVGHQEEDQDREDVDQRHEVHVDHRLVAVAPLGALLQRG